MISSIDLLRQGKPPPDFEALSELTVGIEPFVTFVKEKYLQDYIALGGSKIKFVTGRPGSGKTHFLSYLSANAEQLGFVTVSFSARDVWLHDFKEVYLEIFKRCDLMSCLKSCADEVIKNLGYDPKDMEEGVTFADYLSSIGEFDPITKKEIRNQLRSFFLKNPLIDNNFAAACSLLTGGILGHPTLESSAKELLMGWLSCNSQARLAEVRRLGLSPSKVTKYNARHMLRSLLAVYKQAGKPGIVVTVDDMEILAGKNVMDTIRYTKMKREDAYECIRELIDEIDTLQHVMFIFAFDRKLIDDEISRLKSYQALWMRVQNEIVSDMFNPFTDIIDLDSLGKRIYSRDAMIEMSKRLALLMARNNQFAKPIGDEKAEALLTGDVYAPVALPRQVGQATICHLAENLPTPSECEAEAISGNDSVEGGSDYGF